MYANEGNLENYLTIDVDNSLSAQITAWSRGVDLYIDKYVGKTFANEGVADRYFDGNGGRELDIDNFVSLNSVEILEENGLDIQHTLVSGRENDFIIFPYNKAPYYRLTLANDSRIAVWPKHGNARIKVNAVWGQEAVPEDITIAATMLLAGIVEKGLKGGTVSSESLGDYSVTFKDIDSISEVMGVKAILNLYRILEF